MFPKWIEHSLEIVFTGHKMEGLSYSYRKLTKASVLQRVPILLGLSFIFYLKL